MHVAFAWAELPNYAARCIRAAIFELQAQVTVVATRPSVPIEGMEQSLGQNVHWVEALDTYVDWSLFGVEVPDVLFVSGYRIAAFNTLASKVREAGGKVVLMSDNNWGGGLLKRYLFPLRHRLFFRGKYDAIFVPGASAASLAKLCGYRCDEIRIGLYGADPAVFEAGPPLSGRGKKILFVGQFIERKNVIGLTNAFINVSDEMPDWSLTLCGVGPLAGRIPSHPRIMVRSFVQPSSLAEIFRDVRCLVLPSFEEHWGLVVHEATLSGCAMALSDAIGAADDLAHTDNAVLFRAGNLHEIMDAFLKIANWTDAQWQSAEAKSLELASQFGPKKFSSSVASLVAQLTRGKN